MTKPIVKEIRQLVIDKVFEGMGRAEICNQIKISLSSISRIVSDFTLTGAIDNGVYKHCGAPVILDNGSVEYILELIAANSQLYLHELQHCLHEDFGVEVSLSCLHRNLERMNITDKVITKQAVEQDEIMRELYMMEIMEYTIDQLVFVDETGYNRHSMKRNKGRAIKGFTLLTKVVEPMQMYRLYVDKSIHM